jgi:hypothetical protein
MMVLCEQIESGGKMFATEGTAAIFPLRSFPLNASISIIFFLDMVELRVSVAIMIPLCSNDPVAITTDHRQPWTG